MRSLGRYALRRCLSAIPILFGASSLVFLAVYALPGDPVASLGGGRALPAAAQHAIRDRYRLDRPMYEQYTHYIGSLVRGDLGQSYAAQRPVRTIIAEAIPNTAQLAALAVAIEFAFGVVAGVIAATARRPVVDATILTVAGIAIAVPVYVLATTLQYVVGVRWHLLPISGTDAGPRAWILPACVLAVPSMAYVVRLTSSGLAESLRHGYVETAVAKGASGWRVVTKHALRNALVPVVTFIGADLAALLGGTLFIEAVFNIHGLGLVTVRAISQRDNNVILGASLLFITTFVLLNLVTDLLVALIDPRVRDA